MPLSSDDIKRLATALDENWEIPNLSLLAKDLGVTLGNLAPGLSMYESAVRLVTHLNSREPPQDEVFLEMLGARGNYALKAVAVDLLKPGYFSPTGDAHDAILLGPTAFVDRDDLRKELRKFTSADDYSTRVLVVSGDEPCGKSYTWAFLQHLARATVGATARRLRLRNTGDTPRELVGKALGRLRLDPSALPPMSDDPQLSRIEPLISEFQNQLADIENRYWLVIDDLNDPSVLPQTRETAFALAQAVEEEKPERLWVALLGYNAPITDPELRHVATDDPRFPDPDFVAKHFRCLAENSPKPLTEDGALEIATVLFSQYDPLDKAGMTKLTGLFEKTGKRLRKGQQPWD